MSQPTLKVRSYCSSDGSCVSSRDLVAALSHVFVASRFRLLLSLGGSPAGVQLDPSPVESVLRLRLIRSQTCAHLRAYSIVSGRLLKSFAKVCAERLVCPT